MSRARWAFNDESGPDFYRVWQKALKGDPVACAWVKERLELDVAEMGVVLP